VVERLAAQHRLARRLHERASQMHLHAQRLYERQGESERASRERLLAERERNGADVESARIRALLSGDDAAYQCARALRVPGSLQ
jgi:hypothetical protein